MDIKNHLKEETTSPILDLKNPSKAESAIANDPLVNVEGLTRQVQELSCHILDQEETHGTEVLFLNAQLQAQTQHNLHLMEENTQLRTHIQALSNEIIHHRASHDLAYQRNQAQIMENSALRTKLEESACTQQVLRTEKEAAIAKVQQARISEAQSTTRAQRAEKKVTSANAIAQKERAKADEIKRTTTIMDRALTRAYTLLSQEREKTDAALQVQEALKATIEGLHRAIAQTSTLSAREADWTRSMTEQVEDLKIAISQIFRIIDPEYPVEKLNATPLDEQFIMLAEDIFRLQHQLTELKTDNETLKILLQP